MPKVSAGLHVLADIRRVGEGRAKPVERVRISLAFQDACVNRNRMRAHLLFKLFQGCWGFRSGSDHPRERKFPAPTSSSSKSVAEKSRPPSIFATSTTISWTLRLTASLLTSTGSVTAK